MYCINTYCGRCGKHSEPLQTVKRGDLWSFELPVILVRPNCGQYVPAHHQTLLRNDRDAHQPLHKSSASIKMPEACLYLPWGLQLWAASWQAQCVEIEGILNLQIWHSTQTQEKPHKAEANALRWDWTWQQRNSQLGPWPPHIIMSLKGWFSEIKKKSWWMCCGGAVLLLCSARAACAAMKLMQPDNLCYARHRLLIIRIQTKTCEHRQYRLQNEYILIHILNEWFMDLAFPWHLQ